MASPLPTSKGQVSPGPARVESESWKESWDLNPHQPGIRSSHSISRHHWGTWNSTFPSSNKTPLLLPMGASISEDLIESQEFHYSKAISTQWARNPILGLAIRQSLPTQVSGGRIRTRLTPLGSNEVVFFLSLSRQCQRKPDKPEGLIRFRVS